MDLVKTKKLKFSYSSSETVYTFPDVKLAKGENLLVTGNSGSGKTTLLHLLSGILTPSSGSLKIDDTNTTLLKPHEMDKFRAEKIGIIFQENYFIESLSVLKNLTYINILCGLKPDKLHINKTLKELNIFHLSHKKPRQLSRGELQRFSIARALINKPVLLLADEPTSSLDDDNCKRFVNSMQQTVASLNLSLVVATHDARLKSEFKQSITL